MEIDVLVKLSEEKTVKVCSALKKRTAFDGMNSSLTMLIDFIDAFSRKIDFYGEYNEVKRQKDTAVFGDKTKNQDNFI